MLGRNGVVIWGGAHGALALGRALAARGVAVAFVRDGSALPSYSNVFDHKVTLSADTPEAALREMADFCQMHGWQDWLLVPAADRQVEIISRHHAGFSAHFRLLLPEWDQLRWVCDKPFLYQRAAELALSIPHTYRISQLQEAEALVPIFPVILKPNMGGGSGALARAKVIRADDRESFLAAFAGASAEIGAEHVVVQEYVPGGGESQFSYAALWQNGQPVAEFTARRGRQYPVDFGYTSTFVEAVDVPDATVAARALLSSIGFCGLVEIEFKRDQRDGLLKMLDVNPRPWSWFGLCNAAGVDLGSMLADVIEDKPFSVSTASSGVAWVYLIRDLVAGWTLLRRGDLTLSDFLQSLRHVRSSAAFTIRDPLPGLADLLLTVSKVIERKRLQGS